MLGYCSNSPLRCKNARALVILKQTDACCPECGLFLLPVQSLSQQLRVDARMLRLAFLVLTLILLLLVHIYYRDFV